MSRLMHYFYRALAHGRREIALAWIVIVGALGVSGCAFGPSEARPDVRYDLGPVNSLALSVSLSLSARLPVIGLWNVHAPPILDSEDMRYRLSYVDRQRTGVYARSHWAMTPALLLTQRLRASLAASGAVVLAGGEDVDAPLLRVDLDQFEQVFDSDSQSQGVVRARVTLTDDEGKVLGQHTFVVRVDAATPNAQGGAHALAAASDDFISQLARWLATLPRGASC